MSEISKYHPYNVLWAQMGDLYGAIGSPPKLSKTIVCGTESQTVDKVLNVLTYFIRCGQIERDHKEEVFEKNVIDDILDNFVTCSSGRCDGATGDHHQQSMCSNVIHVSSSSGTDEQPGGDIKPKRLSGGLNRTATCIKDLKVLGGDFVAETETSSIEAVNSSLGTYAKRNDIPNVLIFRDSRFVKQELRIGNFLMDTGIEMNTKQKHDLLTYKLKTKEHIKLLVTSPDNEEYCVVVNDADSHSSSDDTVEEATDVMSIAPPTPPPIDEPVCDLKTSPSLSDFITANSIGSASLINGNGSVKTSTMVMSTNGGTPASFLWGVEPIKEGLSVEQWQNIEKGVSLKAEMANKGGGAVGVCFSDGNVEMASTYTSNSNGTEFKRSKSLYTKSSNVKNSDHIKKSKIARKKSFTDFEGSPIIAAAVATTSAPQSLCNSQDDIENIDPAPNTLKSYPSLSDLITANSVGVSERLTWGIEPVKETVTLDEEQHFEFAKKMIAENGRRDPGGVVFTLGGDNETLVNLKNSEAMKKEAAAAAAASIASTSSAPVPSGSSKKTCCSHKKHSGVKFNFEKYPQIATNYMKNKNIDLAHYDFSSAIEKGLKMDATNSAAGTTTVVSAGDFPLNGANDDGSSEECECCAGRNLSRILQTPSNATELEFSNDDSSYPIGTTTSLLQRKKSCSNAVAASPSSLSSTSTVAPTVTPSIFNGVAKKSVVAAVMNDPNQRNCNTIQLITLPMSKGVRKEDASAGGKQKERKKSSPGFIPSLFVGITDHYIADMVLQVCFSHLKKKTNIFISDLKYKF